MAQGENPIDRARTARPRVGMVMRDARELPGVFLMGLAVATLVVCMITAAMTSPGSTIGLAVIAVVVGLAGIGWFAVEHRRAMGSPAGRHRAADQRHRNVGSI